jgi:hypothetical protein
VTGERRHVLIIASQCAALQELTQLATRARELEAVLIDPDLGACLPGLPASAILRGDTGGIIVSGDHASLLFYETPPS